jgi:hypothetical protein
MYVLFIKYIYYLANFINELHESALFTHKEFVINYYKNFKPKIAENETA